MNETITLIASILGLLTAFLGFLKAYFEFKQKKRERFRVESKKHYILPWIILAFVSILFVFYVKGIIGGQNNCNKFNILKTEINGYKNNLSSDTSDISNKLKYFNPSDMGGSLEKIKKLNEKRSKILRKIDSINSIILPTINLYIENCEQYSTEELDNQYKLIKSDIKTIKK